MSSSSAGGPAHDGARSPRQRELIAAATKLFAQRGYHAVGINEISGELGLTGPAFYRHYPSKEALLVAVFNDAIIEHLQDIRQIVATTPDPVQTLSAIVAHHIDFVFEQTENIVTWRTEFRNIPDEDRRRLRYLQRVYTEEWVTTVRILRPELPLERVRLMCHAAIALLQSPTEFSTRLPRAEVTAILTAMALQTLMGPAVAPARTAPALG